MALWYRRMTEVSKFLPLVFSGEFCQYFGKDLSIRTLSTMPVPSAQKPVTKRIPDRGCHARRFSTMAKVSHEPAAENDLLTFIKASINEFEGTYHCWLNRFGKNKELYGEDGMFVVLAARIFDHYIDFAKLKMLQQRFPHICMMGLQPIQSTADQVHLVQLLMTENITIPILLSKQTFPEMEEGACYILFKNFRSPVIYHEKDLDLETLCRAVQEFQMQATGDSKSLNKLRFTSWNQVRISNEQQICSLQNLLLCHPGCISADESGNRLFLSDCNHHRIIISDGNGEIIDCIGSSPGFEDGDFGSAKLRRPAGSYYHAAEDCLYFVDSENHAIRKADMRSQVVETLYPTSTSNKRSVRIWTWIMSKLGYESGEGSNVDERSAVSDSRSLYFPWHLLKVDDTFFITDRRFHVLWTMDLASGKIKEVSKGSPEILEIYGQQMRENLSLLDQMPCDWLQKQIDYGYSLDGYPHSGLFSSVTSLRNHIIICDTVGQTILKVSKESGICSSFQFSNLGVLGLPYWLTSPLETFYAVGNGISGVPIDHLQRFQLLPGKIDIQLNVDIPMDAELAEPLQEACVWYQARGAATEVSGMEDVPGSLDKVGVAQQWYDELDDLASPTPESDMVVEHDTPLRNSMVEDKKVHITCGVNTSPGTSEVIIYAVLYLKLRREPNLQEDNQEKHAGRILDILSSRRCGKVERDSWKAFLLKSGKDLRDLIFMKLLHIRIKLDCPDHPKADNGRDIILTDSTIDGNVSLN